MPRLSSFYGIVIAMYYKDWFANGRLCIAKSWQRIGNGLASRIRWKRLSPCSSITRMPEIVHVTEVMPCGEHRLRLKFEDGLEGELSFGSKYWRGIFAPLEDPDYFACVELDDELGTIAWPNGADIAPETLHQWVATRADQVSV